MGQPPKCNKVLCIKLLPFINGKLRLWKEVTADNFNKQILAIRHFYDIIDNLSKNKKQLDAYIFEAQQEEDAKITSNDPSSKYKEDPKINENLPSDDSLTSEKSQIQSKPLQAEEKKNETPVQCSVSELLAQPEIHPHATARDIGNRVGQKRPSSTDLKILWRDCEYHKTRAA